MRIAVVGAGAVGGYYGGTLAKHGEQVTLICRGAHRDAIVRDGLHVSSHWGNFTVQVPATADPHEVGPVDLIIYAVKTYHNPEALRLLKPLLGADTASSPYRTGSKARPGSPPSMVGSLCWPGRPTLMRPGQPPVGSSRWAPPRASCSVSRTAPTARAPSGSPTCSPRRASRWR